MTSEIIKLKKLTPKDIGNEVPQGGGKLLGKCVMLIHGYVNGYTMKATQYGESACFMGDFTAVDPLTNKTYAAPQAYFPADFAGMLQQKVDKADGGEVEFKAQVTVVPSEKAARGYAFLYENINTPEITRRRHEMAAGLLEGCKALPEAEKTIAIEDKTESKKKSA